MLPFRVLQRFALRVLEQGQDHLCWPSVLLKRTSRPHTHLTIALLRAPTLVPGAIEQINGYVTWGKVAVILKTLGRSGAIDANAKHSSYLPIPRGIGRLLSENFIIPGWVWSPSYPSAHFFDGRLLMKMKIKGSGIAKSRCTSHRKLSWAVFLFAAPPFARLFLYQCQRNIRL
jgi:hypothetical protein